MPEALCTATVYFLNAQLHLCFHMLPLLFFPLPLVISTLPASRLPGGPVIRHLMHLIQCADTSTWPVPFLPFPFSSSLPQDKLSPFQA